MLLPRQWLVIAITKGNTHPKVTITGNNPTIGQLNAIAGATDGVVTATVSDTVQNLVNNLQTGGLDRITITASSGVATIANLKTLVGNCSYHFDDSNR